MKLNKTLFNGGHFAGGLGNFSAKETYTNGALYYVQVKTVFNTWRDDTASGKWLNANVEKVGKTVFVKGVAGYPKETV